MPSRPSGASLGVQQCLVEFGRRSCIKELLAKVLPPDQARDTAENFHMLAGGGLRPDDEEKEPHRLVIDRVVRNRRGTHSTDQSELPNGGRPGMGNGHAET